ncbi:hypothetical protein SEPCBS57363_005776 [Sporothrix epigloea]|uniref:Uncharacterized protein n=1 Tax=Sporothrix epigloea TaxID=1892477 RepID=A0ABP0E3K0_9PEZI
MAFTTCEIADRSATAQTGPSASEDQTDAASSSTLRTEAADQPVSLEDILDYLRQRDEISQRRDETNRQRDEKLHSELVAAITSLTLSISDQTRTAANSSDGQIPSVSPSSQVTTASESTAQVPASTPKTSTSVDSAVEVAGGCSQEDMRKLAFEWESQPYMLDSTPAPSEDLVRQVFPPLSSPSDSLAAESFDIFDYPPSSIDDIPSLVSTRDPELARKLEKAQYVFRFNFIPKKLWAFYLASNMSGDFEEIRESINLETEWHHCVWAIVTAVEGLHPYLHAREEALRAASVPGPLPKLRSSLQTLCRCYREAPTLFTTPSGRIYTLYCSLYGWGPLMPKNAFTKYLEMTDTELSLPKAYVWAISAIGADLRDGYRKHIAVVQRLNGTARSAY